MSKSKGSPCAMTEGELAVLDLTLPTFTPELLDGLNHQENPTHAGVVGRQSAPVGINRQLTAKADTSVLDERTAFTFFTKAKTFQGHTHCYGERVLDHGHVKVCMLHSGPLHSLGTGLFGSCVSEITHTRTCVRAGFCRTHNIDWLFLEIACPFG